MPLDALAEFGLKERTRRAGRRRSTSGGPAAKAGVEPGDVILEFNGKPVKNRDELVGYVSRTRPGTTVPVKVLRDKAEKTLNLTVDELDLEAEASRAPQRDDAPSPTSRPRRASASRWARSRRTWRAACALPSDTEGVLITDVEPAARRTAPAWRAATSSLQVNRRPVTRRGGGARSAAWPRAAPRSCW